MPRNRYKHKHTKNAISAPVSQEPVGEPSRTAQRIIDRIARGGQEYLIENAERILIDSASLAEEPEFIDLYLNREKVAQVTEFWLEKYETRLRAAEKEGSDEFQMAYDDVRIKIIDELATPAFRKLFKNRLAALRNRLLPTNDAHKLELALTIEPMLTIKEVPWGLCGLIIAVYNRTLEQSLEKMHEEDEVLETVIQALKDEGEELIDPEELLSSPDKIDLVSEKILKDNPKLRERLEKQATQIMDAFEDELSEGKIALTLFTEDEILLPFKRLEEELGSNIQGMQPDEKTSRHIFDTIVQSVKDIMTPERFQRFRKDAETIANTWLRQGNKWAGPLKIEVSRLAEDLEYENDPFVMRVFFAQFRRFNNTRQAAPKGKKKKR